jgi:hypothetical protein
MCRILSVGDDPVQLPRLFAALPQQAIGGDQSTFDRMIVSSSADETTTEVDRATAEL